MLGLIITSEREEILGYGGGKATGGTRSSFESKNKYSCDLVWNALAKKHLPSWRREVSDGSSGSVIG